MKSIIPIITVGGLLLLLNTPKKSKSTINNNGFKISNCQKIIVINREKMNEFFCKIVFELSNDSRFQNPKLVDFLDFSKTFIEKIDTKCFKYAIKDDFSNFNIFIICYYLMQTSIYIYLYKTYQIDSISGPWSKFFSSKEEMDKIVQEKLKYFNNYFLNVMKINEFDENEFYYEVEKLY